MYCPNCGQEQRCPCEADYSVACRKQHGKTDVWVWSPEQLQAMYKPQVRVASEDCVQSNGLDIMVLKIYRKDKSVELPKYEKIGDSGLDLRSIEDIELKPLSRVVVRTGLIIELPPGHEGQVRPRSGLAAKYGITVLNTPGTIDNHFRGEVKVILLNTSSETFKVEKGMRIAQLVVSPVATVEVYEVGEEEMVKTERGAGGFGSTGHK